MLFAPLKYRHGILLLSVNRAFAGTFLDYHQVFCNLSSLVREHIVDFVVSRLGSNSIHVFIGGLHNWLRNQIFIA